MNLAEYYKKSEPVFGVAKILFLRLFELYEHYPISKIAESTSGGTPNRGNAEYYNGNIPWLKSGELNDSIIEACSEYITEEGLKNSSAKLFPKDTLLVAMYGATAGKTGILNFDATTNQAVCALFPNSNVERDYLHWFLRQHRIDFILQSKGGAQPNISQKVIKETVIPVPPLAIQKEVIKFLNDVQNDSFVNSDFDVLDNISLKKINRFYKIRNTYQILNKKSGSQKQLHTQLKQSILQEAIQGKLTEEWRAQNPISSTFGGSAEGDGGLEPATELLKRIKAEKSKLIKDKKIKKEKALPPITAEEIPFELPEGWVWCKLGDICSKTGSGSTPKGGKSAYPSSGIKFLRSQNVYDEGLRYDGIAFISDVTHEKMKGTKVLPEDLLLNITGGSIGRCCIVPKDFDTGNINQHVAIIRSVFSENGYYLHKIICSPYFQNMIIEVQTGAGREGLPKNKMDNILIPCPPVEEQKAIVEKVETLMQKCQALEQEIQTSEANAQMLMQAVLKEAFLPAETAVQAGEGKQEEYAE